MLAGVKSQMSGWLSGGIPGLGRGGGPAEGEIPAPQEPVESQTSNENVQGSTSEHVKDDDASRWVAGYVCVQCSGIETTSYYRATGPSRGLS